MKVLFFGSMNIDTTFKLDHIVKPGETQSSCCVSVGAGGKGANQCAAFAKALGKACQVKVMFAGKCGDDGAFIVKKLSELGVDVSLVMKSDCGTGKAMIQLDRNGQNSIVLYGGGNQDIDEIDADKVLSGFGEGDMLFVNCEISSLGHIVHEAHRKGMKVVLNPSPVNAALREISLDDVDSIILNETEAEALGGVDSIARSNPSRSIVYTKGADGAEYRCTKTRLCVAAQKVDVVDTTGAGDTFMGYFYASLVRGLDVKSSMELAARAAGVAVTRPGAMDSVPCLEELS